MNSGWCPADWAGLKTGALRQISQTFSETDEGEKLKMKRLEYIQLIASETECGARIKEMN